MRSSACKDEGMKMVFTETTMHVLASIIDGLTVIISVVMVGVSVSSVIITKLPVTIVVAMSVSVHHRRRHGWAPINTARISWIRSLALHRHCILRVVVIHRGIRIISTASSTSSISVHLRRSRVVLVLKRFDLIIPYSLKKRKVSLPFRSPSVVVVVAVVVGDGDRPFHSAAAALAADSSSAWAVALA